jgi:hypothetical protein
MFTKTMLQRDVCLLLADRLRELRPKVAVEFGSGFSTALVALYADETLSLDNSTRWAAPWPCVRICDVRGGTYKTNLPDGIEFALIDGPRAMKYGRQGTFPHLWPHLAEAFEVWLDDADREHEQTILADWQKRFPINVEYVATGKGLAVITRREGSNDA